MIGVEFIGIGMSFLAICIAAYTHYKMGKKAKKRPTKKQKIKQFLATYEKAKIKEEIIDRLDRIKNKDKFIAAFYVEWDRYSNQGFTIQDFEDIRLAVDFRIEHKIREDVLTLGSARR